MKGIIGLMHFYEQSALKMFVRGEAEYQTFEHEAHNSVSPINGLSFQYFIDSHATAIR